MWPCKFGTCFARTDHDLDHQGPNLPLYVVQDLYSADSTQETCLHRADCTGPTRQSELHHTDQETHLP